MITHRMKALCGALAVSTLALSACSSDSGSTTAVAEVYRVGINQLVQHPALDATVTGFKKAFDTAGVEVEFVEQNANGEQATALSIAQQFSNDRLDLVLAVATPAAQATAQQITDIPVLFTAVTDPVAADLVDSNEAPGANITGTSDAAPIDEQIDLLQELVPDAKKVGIVYSSGEVNSEVQIKQFTELAQPKGIEVTTQAVSAVNEIQQAVESLGDVDAIYVPTDNMIVSGIASLSQVANQKQIPVIAAEEGTVEGGAIATVGINYEELGRQTGEMALRILQEGADPATMPVETADTVTTVINEEAAKAQGVEIPEAILNEATTV